MRENPCFPALLRSKKRTTSLCNWARMLDQMCLRYGSNACSASASVLPVIFTKQFREYSFSFWGWYLSYIIRELGRAAKTRASTEHQRERCVYTIGGYGMTCLVHISTFILVQSVRRLFHQFLGLGIIFFWLKLGPCSLLRVSAVKLCFRIDFTGRIRLLSFTPTLKLHVSYSEGGY